MQLRKVNVLTTFLMNLYDCNNIQLQKDITKLIIMSDEILRANIYELDDTTMPELVAMSREELENKYRSIQAGEC